MLAHAAFIALAVCSGPARAQGSADLERARALFKEGRALVERTLYGEACARFEQSLKIEAGMGTRYNLADCWEHVGRSASAHALFLGVAAEARAAGKSERERVARARAEALEPRLSRLAIEVPAEARGLRIRRNRVLVEPALFGAAVAIDPGAYEIEAVFPNGERWSKHVQVAATDSLVIVSIPPRRPARPPANTSAKPPKVAAPPALTRAPAPVAPAPHVPPLDPPMSPTVRAVTLGLGALGAAGVATGTVFALKYKARNDAADDVCAGGVGCSPADVKRHDAFERDARAARTGAVIGFGLGGAALASAALFYFKPSLLERETDVPTSFRAEPTVSLDGAWGVSARGSF
jgi:serine/threonine-protein kinase